MLALALDAACPIWYFCSHAQQLAENEPVSGGTVACKNTAVTSRVILDNRRPKGIVSESLVSIYAMTLN